MTLAWVFRAFPLRKIQEVQVEGSIISYLKHSETILPGWPTWLVTGFGRLLAPHAVHPLRTFRDRCHGGPVHRRETRRPMETGATDAPDGRGDRDGQGEDWKRSEEVHRDTSGLTPLLTPCRPNRTFLVF